MKRKLTLVIILLLFTFVLLTACNSKNEPKTVILIQYGSYSLGSHWDYELSTEGVIKEVKYYESNSIFNLGPGYQQNWEFEIIGEGEVTIHWLSYVCDRDLKESECYSETYFFDSEGNYAIKTDYRN